MYLRSALYKKNKIVLIFPVLVYEQNVWGRKKYFRIIAGHLVNSYKWIDEIKLKFCCVCKILLTIYIILLPLNLLKCSTVERTDKINGTKYNVSYKILLSSSAYDLSFLWIFFRTMLMHVCVNFLYENRYDVIRIHLILWMIKLKYKFSSAYHILFFYNSAWRWITWDHTIKFNYTILAVYVSKGVLFISLCHWNVIAVTPGVGSKIIKRISIFHLF